MHRWAGPLRGGLAVGTVVICTLFAAMSGVSAAGTVTMGIIALPQMLRRGYDKRIAIGCIMAGGALGVLIPPSIVMIIYGLFSGVSVGRLFMGGILPGLILSSLFIAYILIRCSLNPSLGPALPPAERSTLGEKLTSLRAVILPVLLVVSVLGSIFFGLATPTEAAAVGAFGSLICAAIYRKLTWGLLKDSAFRTMRVTAMIMWIIFAAGLFTSVYQGLGAPKLIKDLLEAFPLGSWGILILIQLTYFALGCFVDAISILMITAPVFLPIAAFVGFDPLWFGILYVVNIEMGYLTPPFGANLFYMKGIAPPGVTMGDIYRSVLPFVLLQAVGLALVILFPPIATWLPSLMFKS